MECPKCNNPNLRHKGEKKKIVSGTRKELDREVKNIYWTEKGYYCKKCGFEGELKNVR